MLLFRFIAGFKGVEKFNLAVFQIRLNSWSNFKSGKKSVFRRKASMHSDGLDAWSLRLAVEAKIFLALLQWSFCKA